MQLRLSRIFVAIILMFAFLCPLAGQTVPVPNDRTLLGFDRASSAAQRALEARFDATLNPNDLRTWMKRLSARPHHLGSPYGKENAEFIAAQFRAWGFDTKIEEFSVLFPTPKTRVVEMIAPEKFTAALTEPVLAEDATSNQIAEQLPVYNAYSVDGEVTAPLVYVNYGVPRDYEELAERGIDVKGKIVIARYGGSWRGIKPKVAAEHGAIGCLIYSDPRNDGFYQGDVYPKGPWRNETGAQRGSVADMPLFPGDPLTPGIGATAGREAARTKERAHADKDSRPAHLLPRCAAVVACSRRPTRPGRLAGRTTPDLSHRPWSGDGPSQGRIQLGPGDRVQRDRETPRFRAAGRVGHPRQSPRRLGQWRGRSFEWTGGYDGRGTWAWRVDESWLETKAHYRLLLLGW